MSASAALALVLLIVLPAEVLWRDWRKLAPPSKGRRYVAAMVKAAALLAALLVVARTEGLTASALGLGYPIGTAGWIGLAVSAIVIGALVLTTFAQHADAKPVRRRPMRALMPESPRERRLFLFMVPLISFAWEALYRGYLLWWLAPHFGLPFAVVAASLAYALAHGWKSAGAVAAALGSALFFTTGYALTASLWWLIILHAAFPLIGLLAMRRVATPVANMTA